ncbi:MAG TPA: EAL domain-containing protein, partial [Solirubrobacterales bacterium]|nr:EAL domain-containing protein [Solirubrobacterales bacterium]
GVAVNLSARQLADHELIPHVEGSIRANGIEPSTLWLELTESTVLDDTTYVERTLGALQRLGVKLVLDDFGVGFSSLGYLKRLPLSMVKLHRTFVEDVADSPHDAAIVRAVSEMAETIGLGVVAEGVETEEQVRVARDLGCGYGQGFHFAEPVPASYAERLLATPMPVSG